VTATTTPTKADVPVARIAGPFGVRGELKCDPTDAGRTLVLPGAEFRCDFSETPIATAGAVPAESVIRLAAVRPHKGRLLVRVDGVDDADVAERYRGATLYTSRDRVEVAPGEYLDADLVGCEVFDADGRRYGAVDSVAHYPASDMLIVAGVMVPMVSEFIRSVDVTARRIVIAPPAGLFE
jgi:16S rRNA processing protein RimM